MASDITVPTKHERLLAWVEEVAGLTMPDTIHWCDGTAEEYDELCQALVDCVNECRRLAGKRAVDPRLSLADCPRHLLVQPRAMWSPGCDWIQQAYQLADIPQPALVPNTPAHHAPGQSPAAA